VAQRFQRCERAFSLLEGFSPGGFSQYRIQYPDSAFYSQDLLIQFVSRPSTIQRTK
jgi:hypothetical protein